MNIRPLFVAAALLVSLSLTAKDLTTCSHAKHQVAAIPDFPKRPYDIFLYRLTLDLRQAFDQKQAAYSASAEIHLNTTEVTEVIEFDAANMVMTRIVLNGEELIPTPQPEGGVLSILLPAALQASDTFLTITIDYERSGNENRGAYFYPKGYFVGLGPKPAEDSVFVEEDIFYTMCEPFDARYWMPCNDHPHDKMNTEILVLVPSDITVTSNGDLISHEVGDATDRWSWASDKPMPSYLIVVNASKFVSWQEKVARYHNPADSLPLSYHVWQADYDQDSITDGSKYNARHAFRNTPYMITAFEKYFGPYPFSKYGQTAVQPINIGGMEHQSMTTVTRAWLRGWSEAGIAHEIGHQWFGDKVTCETFKDLWLNEGFATYTEAIYNESWGGNQWYMNSMSGKARGYFEAPQHSVRNDFAIYDPPQGELFNGAITYNKAGCVLHQLRRLVSNDSAFFGAIRSYLDAFAYDNASTETFAATISNALGLDLTEFFDQWIYGALHPDFSILWAQNPVGRLYLRINQLQTVRDHFTMPLRFFAYHEGIVDTIQVTVSSRSQSWSGIVAGTVDSVLFDKDFGLLSTYSVAFDASLSVDEAVEEMSITQDVLTHEIVCRSSEDDNYRVDIYDALGKCILSERSTSTVHRIQAKALPSGVYTVRVIGDSKSFTRSMPVAR